MPIALTSDPIISEQLARDLLKWPSDDMVRMSINSVSARFLKYTNRLRITSGTLTEKIRGLGGDQFWLHATPAIDVTSLSIYYAGDVYETLTAADYTLDAETGHIYLHDTGAWYSADERNIVISYTGGWTTVPYDVQDSALLLMQLDKRRREGEIGLTGKTRDGESVTLEGGDIPRPVADRWSRYKVMA